MIDFRSVELPPSFYNILGFMLLILGWEALARNYSGLVVATPVETMSALFRLLGDKGFLMTHLVPTLKRIALSLCIGIGSGAVLGVLAGLIEPLRLMLAPIRWILTSIPGIIVVVVFMLWFGMGTTMVVSITSTMIAPIVYVNVAESMMNVDSNLIEMARVYRMPLHMRLTRIYAMALARPLLSAVVIATGNCIRLVVLAEMLGTNKGLGHALAISRTNLQTDSLYALTMLAMIIIGGVEIFMLRPARKAIERKQTCPSSS
ncbi:ABC transporter permease [Maridesulfovibrio salexigens]|uniref:Binding-protein-dependent transport systems inner membrane component n=1 Tax=Maridesulfovibrio salexigens (strain ATCC 14822 / DSM 2638 / NCIMB 8403 / VKM B-1763) TaxID=526222 RepID=C6BUC7_MARSD|nr:ABC transporter permease subunit [Maridesulfovibrio salexigens]ACS79936.1 binding-protein-dependent transport systems inner membrane component [Maridesulfovibrio salexigens DSM 2638]